MGVRITKEQFSQIQEEVKYYERVRRYVFDSLIVQTPLDGEDTSETVLVMKKTSLVQRHVINLGLGLCLSAIALHGVDT